MFGQQVARAWSMPASCATALAVAWLSPVSMTGVIPSARSEATASRDDGLIVSATANSAMTRSGVASSVTVRPPSSCCEALFQRGRTLAPLLDQAVVAQP